MNEGIDTLSATLLENGIYTQKFTQNGTEKSIQYKVDTNDKTQIIEMSFFNGTETLEKKIYERTIS